MDYSNPEIPLILGAFSFKDLPNEGIIGFKVRGNRAYVLFKYMGFRIYDITDFQNPILINKYIEPDDGSWVSSYSMEIDSNLVYLSDQNASINIIDISNEYDIKLLGSRDHNRSIDKMQISGKYLYATYISNRFSEVFSISDPSNPVLVKTLDYDGINNSQIDNNRLYLIKNNSRPLVYDVSNPNTVEELSTKSYLDSRIYDFTVIENYLYAAQGNNGLAIIDISDITSPKLKNIYDKKNPVKILINDDIIYFETTGSFNTLYRADISDPLNIGEPELLFKNSTTNWILIDDLIYYSGSSGLNVFNLATNETTTINVAEVNEVVYSFAIGSNKLFLSKLNTLEVYNIENYQNPVLINKIDTPKYLFHLKYNNGYLIGSDFSNLYVYTTNDLKQISTFSGSASSIYLTTSFFYSTEFTKVKKYTILDFMDVGVETPQIGLERTYTGGGNFIKVFEKGNYIIAADQFNGLYIFQNDFVTTIDEYNPTLADNFILNNNYPNPFNPITKIPFTIKKSGKIELNIFDLSGRLIKNLINQQLSSGIYSTNWDGTNILGIKVSSGTYFYQLKNANSSIVKKMLLIK